MLTANSLLWNDRTEGPLRTVRATTRLLRNTFQGCLLFGAALAYYLFETTSVAVRTACIVCFLAEVFMLSRAAFLMDETRERRRFLLLQHFYMLGATLLLGLVVFS